MKNRYLTRIVPTRTVLATVGWNSVGVVHCKVQLVNFTITVDIYNQQLENLNIFLNKTDTQFDQFQRCGVL